MSNSLVFKILINLNFHIIWKIKIKFSNIAVVKQAFQIQFNINNMYQNIKIQIVSKLLRQIIVKINKLIFSRMKNNRLIKINDD